MSKSCGETRSGGFKLTSAIMLVVYPAVLELWLLLYPPPLELVAPPCGEDRGGWEEDKLRYSAAFARDDCCWLWWL